MRSDGTEFPAELAISRVDIPGPPLFTACIRDISDRADTEDLPEPPSSAIARSSSSSRSSPTSTTRTILARRRCTSARRSRRCSATRPRSGSRCPDLFPEAIHEDDRRRVPGREDRGLCARRDAAAGVSDAHQGRSPHLGRGRFRARGPARGRGAVPTGIRTRHHRAEASRRGRPAGRDALPGARRAASPGGLHRSESTPPARTCTRALRSRRCSATRSRSGLPTRPSSSSSCIRTTGSECSPHTSGRMRRRALHVEYRLFTRNGRVVWVHDEAHDQGPGDRRAGPAGVPPRHHSASGGGRAAPPPGVPRPAHRSREPCALHRPRRACAGRPFGRRGRALPRPRRLQGGQRRSRPRRRGCLAASGRSAVACVALADPHRGADGWRRVRDPRGAGGRERCARRGRADHCRPAGAVRPRRPRGVRHGERRHRGRWRRGGAAAVLRRRHVRRESKRQGSATWCTPRGWTSISSAGSSSWPTFAVPHRLRSSSCTTSRSSSC